MLVPEELPENPQRPLKRLSRPWQIPKVLEHAAEVVHEDGHLGMFRPERLLVDSEGTFECVFRLGELGANLQVDSDVI